MAKKVKFSIRNKLLGMITFVLLLTVLLILIFSIKFFQKDKLTFIYDFNVSTVHSRAREVKSEITGTLERLDILARSIQYGYGNEKTRQEISGNIFSQDENLIAFNVYEKKDEAGDDFRVRADLINTEALELYDLTEDYLDEMRARWPINFKEVIAGELFIFNSSTPSGLPLMTIAFPYEAEEDGRFNKVLTADIKPEKFLRIFEMSGLAMTYLVDGRGDVLAHPDPDAVLNHKNLAHLKVVEDAIEKELVSGTREFIDPNGEAFIGAYSRVGIGGLIVISQITKSKAFQAARQLITKSLLLVLVILLIAVVVGFLFSRGLTNPIKRLHDATLKVAGGDFDVDVKASSRDEIGDLAGSFNIMSTKIVDLLKETADKARMEKELVTAKTVQETLFPKTDPTFDMIEFSGFYESASETGGDWYGYVVDEERDRVSILIGDVTGHGAPAALVTAATNSFVKGLNIMKTLHRSSHSISEYLSRDPSSFPQDIQDKIKDLTFDPMAPANLLKLLNRIILETTNRQLVMTFFASIFDLKTRTITFANAGHNFPILYQKNGAESAKGDKKLKILRARGVRLGDEEVVEFKESSKKLDAGDVIFWYTDGLIECVNQEGEEYGKKRLQSVLLESINLSADEIKEKIIEDSYGFFGDTPKDDDITFVVGKVVG